MNTRLSPEHEKRLSERYASPDWINELDACDIAEDFAALLAELDAERLQVEALSRTLRTVKELIRPPQTVADLIEASKQIREALTEQTK